ncbi:hypothetical protein PACTADRAFT_52156 [Pachysolen tannophilus NRRL Y-2460]|uniref:J domain-containing protein n=1 Tax=Pachysolen tannophilus NRRL Y-2460 TaxID=669874 RepID=A0A1E4TMU9_PACTA|nr:hypothetical protein PACTADRAFT_52156 [Pachysolen tannophilus NRRL Y-2460]
MMYGKGDIYGASSLSRYRLKTIKFSFRSASTNSNETDHYNVLGVNQRASQKEIKSRYRALSKKYHPDLNSSLSEQDKTDHNEKFIKINHSYEILGDVEKRKNYDAKLASSGNDFQYASHVANKRKEFHKKYYGSSDSNKYKPSGLNSTRNRVHFDGRQYADYRSIFNGEHRDHSVNDVPHFDYAKHLRKNILLDKRYSQSHGYKGSDIKTHEVYVNSFPRHAFHKDIHKYNLDNNENTYSTRTEAAVYGSMKNSNSNDGTFQSYATNGSKTHIGNSTSTNVIAAAAAIFTVLGAGMWWDKRYATGDEKLTSTRANSTRHGNEQQRIDTSAGSEGKDQKMKRYSYSEGSHKLPFSDMIRK